MLLAFEFYNTKLLLHRPCLCKFGDKIPFESAKSEAFNRSAAITCVAAARETIALLPEQPNAKGLNTSGPWWCMMYYLVTAGIVIMIEMILRADHVPDQAEELVKDAQRLLRWLKAMGSDNLAARRSYDTLSRLMVYAAPRVGKSQRTVPFVPPSSATGGSSHSSGMGSEEYFLSPTERPFKRRTPMTDESLHEQANPSPAAVSNDANLPLTSDEAWSESLFALLKPLRPPFLADEVVSFHGTGGGFDATMQASNASSRSMRDNNGADMYMNMDDQNINYPLSASEASHSSLSLQQSPYPTAYHGMAPTPVYQTQSDWWEYASQRQPPLSAHSMTGMQGGVMHQQQQQQQQSVQHNLIGHGTVPPHPSGQGQGQMSPIDMQTSPIHHRSAGVYHDTLQNPYENPTRYSHDMSANMDVADDNIENPAISNTNPYANLNR